MHLFVSQDMTAGELNALVKKVGGRDAALRIIQGESIVMRPRRFRAHVDGQGYIANTDSRSIFCATVANFSQVFGDAVQIEIALPFDFGAKVIRTSENQEEIVEITTNALHASQKKIFLFKRHMDGQPGDFSVSCQPRLREATVESINIQFRSYDDKLTNRGLLWVTPPKTGYFFLAATNTIIRNGELVASLLNEAETALRTQFLDKLKQ